MWDKGQHQQMAVKYCKNIEKTRTFRVCLVSGKIGGYKCKYRRVGLWHRHGNQKRTTSVLEAVKGLKEAVLDAGMRITEKTNSRPRNREQKHNHGTEAERDRLFK